jgi:hypothetical protein
MIEPVKNDYRCIRCGSRMRFSCQETDEPGFIHDVFECRSCQSTQSFVTPERPPELDGRGQHTKDERSGRHTRSEAEKQFVGERRSLVDRRSNQDADARAAPSKVQFSIFAKRVRRAMRDEKSRHLFGVTSGEGDFIGHADVLRSLEWIERLARD